MGESAASNAAVEGENAPPHRTRRKVPRKWPAVVALAVIVLARLALSGMSQPTLVALPVVAVAVVLWIYALRAAPQRGRSWVDEMQRWREVSRPLSREDRRRVRRSVRADEDPPAELSRPAAAWAHHRVMTADFLFWLSITAGAMLQAQMLPDIFPFVFYGGSSLIVVAAGLAELARRRRLDRDRLRARREAARSCTRDSGGTEVADGRANG